MTKAIWNGAVLAESDACIALEGYTYFPSDAVDMRFLRPSQAHTHCSWKGEASYYDVVVGDAINRDAAWTYAQPSEAARRIAGHIGFWRGVRIES